MKDERGIGRLEQQKSSEAISEPRHKSTKSSPEVSTRVKNLSLFKVKTSSLISKVKEGARTWLQVPL